jgi:hypothetical protein
LASIRRHRLAWRLWEALPTMRTMLSANLRRSEIDGSTMTSPRRRRSRVARLRCSTT